MAARAGTPVFIPPFDLAIPGHYGLQACPALYPGQLLEADLEADPGNAGAVAASLYVRVYGPSDAPLLHRGPATSVGPGSRERLAWRVPETGSAPIYEVGLEIAGEKGAAGTLYLDRLAWSGEPDTVLGPQAGGGTAWRRAWADAMSSFMSGRKEALRCAQNRGTGLLIQGGCDWRDYEASTDLTVYMARSAGIAVRVQGLRRYAALLLCDDGMARLVRVFDRERRVLAEAPCPCPAGSTHSLVLRARGESLRGVVDGKVTLEAAAGAPPSGALAFVCEEGTAGTDRIVVKPAL